MFEIIRIIYSSYGTRQKRNISQIFKPCPDCDDFGRLPIILDGSNSFWTGPNHFGQFQIIKISPEKSNWNLTKIIWTCPKQIGRDQNNLYRTKITWPVQNLFGPIEGQGINLVLNLKKSGLFLLRSLMQAWFSWPSLCRSSQHHTKPR